MARGGGCDNPGNNLGQCFTSLSPFHYVQGASGAQTGAVEGAAGRSKMREFSSLRGLHLENGQELRDKTQ